MKTHYASVERGNESDPMDYWSDTVCGIESENLDNDWSIISCKRCLKRKEQYKKEMKFHMEQNCKDTAQFVEFMESGKIK